MRGEHQYDATACFIYPHPVPARGRGDAAPIIAGGFHVPAACDLAVTTWNQMRIPVARHFNGAAMIGNIQIL
jgi:hypothetical protein